MTQEEIVKKAKEYAVEKYDIPFEDDSTIKVIVAEESYEDGAHSRDPEIEELKNRIAELENKLNINDSEDDVDDEEDERIKPIPADIDMTKAGVGDYNFKDDSALLEYAIKIAVDNPDECEKFFTWYVKFLIYKNPGYFRNTEHAVDCARRNIGYFSGYFDGKSAEAAKKAYHSYHPFIPGW